MESGINQHIMCLISAAIFGIFVFLYGVMSRTYHLDLGEFEFSQILIKRGIKSHVLKFNFEIYSILKLSKLTNNFIKRNFILIFVNKIYTCSSGSKVPSIAMIDDNNDIIYFIDQKTEWPKPDFDRR